MAKRPFMNSEDKEYVKSGRWKCAESPTGAHHWVEKEKGATTGLFICKYCLDVKRMRTAWTRPS